MLYHVTALMRLRTIMREGLLPGAMTLAEQVFRAEEAIAEGEEVELCEVDAQYMLDEALRRPPAVYFWTDIDQAYDSMTGVADLGLELVVLGIDPRLIPCECSVDDARIADDLYTMYYEACMGMAVVNDEKEQELIEEWERSVEVYDVRKRYPSWCEVMCPCVIPPTAIRVVYTENRRRLDVGAWMNRRKKIEY